MPDLDQPSRAELFAKLDARGEPFDVAVIGGGASGLGVAVDAAARGFATALFEAEDFAKGTSSRATKLIHGGVRYLARGEIALVREALRERHLLLDNAPHLVQPLGFVLPAYGWRGRLWDRFFYGAGLTAYDALAGRARLGRTRLLDAAAAQAAAPGIRGTDLAGAVCYQDAQFDDARLALALARTAVQRGACVLNHARVTALESAAGLHEIEVEDRETGVRRRVRARCVVNATGVWVDGVRRLEEPQADDLVLPSRGAHLVVGREFFPSDHALLVPRTPDGRVLFAVPWLGSVILGTTDTPSRETPLEPRPLEAEIEFILAAAARHLARAPERSDVRSAWAGLRPLVKPAGAAGRATQRLSREHLVTVSPHGLMTVTGGKWTTYRAMAEDVLATCFAKGLLPARPAGVTRSLRLVGAPPPGDALRPLSAPPGLHLYGSEAPAVAGLPGADHELLPGLTEAMVRFAVRKEYARTVEDVLARRSRWLFLDAARSAVAAMTVAEIMADELGPAFDASRSAAAFVTLARGYLPGT